MVLKPFVYWAQTEREVTLRVELQNVADLEVVFEEDEVELSALGVGAQGGEERRRYHFVIEFYLPVDKDLCSYSVAENGAAVSMILPKKDPDWWPRLLHQQLRLPWLKVDFDRWQQRDVDEDGNDEGRDPPERSNGFDYGSSMTSQSSSEELLRSKYPEVFRELERQELGSFAAPNFVPEKIRKTYLFMYNLFMLTQFLYLGSVLALRCARHGGFDEFVSRGLAWSEVGNLAKMAHLFMALEVLHPLFGYTSASLLNAFVLVAGRNFVLLALVEAEDRMQDKPVVFYLLAVYIASEVVRYPYYLLKVYDIDVGLVTWLRYTCWILLYPAGFLCEGVITLRAIPYFEETGRFSIPLPNRANLSFHFPNLLRVLLLFCYFPVMYNLMNSMYHRRCRKLNIRQYSLNRNRAKKSAKDD